MGSMEHVSKPKEGDQKFELPTCFQFHLADEELINHYLAKIEPRDFPGFVKMGEAEWYYFYTKDKKYPIGLKENKATDTGYWKTTGKDKEIIKENVLIGMKKTLVFYKGKAPKGEKTNWVMDEYNLEEWVICIVYETSPYKKKMHIPKFERINFDLYGGTITHCFSIAFIDEFFSIQQ